MATSTTAKDSNNVNLADDRALQRALEQWQPGTAVRWGDMGPEAPYGYGVYLRTAVSVDAGGWAYLIT